MIKKSIYYFSKYKESVCRTFSRPSGVIYDQFPIAQESVFDTLNSPAPQS